MTPQVNKQTNGMEFWLIFSVNHQHQCRSIPLLCERWDRIVDIYKRGKRNSKLHEASFLEDEDRVEVDRKAS